MSSDPSHLVLVGLMGAGKTAVGRICARRLNRPFVDTDAVAASRAGRPIADIWADSGEAAFRQLERAAVAEACANPNPCVVACGGGAVVDPANRDLLRRSGFVAWLAGSVETLAERVGSGANRPLLQGGNPKDVLGDLATAREPDYVATAHVRLATDGLSADSVADAVIDAYRAWASASETVGP